MADNNESIRGITLQIAADGAKFKDTMSSLTGEVKTAQGELKSLQKSLELEFDPSKLERAQKVVQTAIEKTREQTDLLRARMEYLEKEGNVDTAQYRKLQADLAKAELTAQQLTGKLEALDHIQIDALEKELQSTEKQLDDLQKSLELEFDQSKFERAQRSAGDAIKKNEQQAELLRAKLQELEKSGKIDTDAYRDLQSELDRAEERAKELGDRLQAVTDMDPKKLTNRLNSLGESLTAAGQKLMPLSVGAGAAVAGVTALGVKSAAAGAEIDDLSQRLGLSAEKVQEWKYVTTQAGVDFEVFEKALIKGRAAVLDLSQGVENNATRALRELGISTANFESPEEMFEALLNGLAGMEDKTAQAAYANEIFGDKIANQMVPYLNAGADAINQFKEEFSTVGALSSEQIESLAALDDTVNLLKASFENAGMQLGAAFQPLLQILADFIAERVVPMIQAVAEWIDALPPGMQGVVLGILGILAIAAPLLSSFGMMATGISGLIKLFKALEWSQIKAAAGFGSILLAMGLVLDLIVNWEKMSVIEGVLKSISAAAFVAAAAFTVFHASWSMGAAIGAIATGVVAGLAAIGAAEQQVMGEGGDYQGISADDMASSYDIDAIVKEIQDADNIDYDYNVYDTVGAGGGSGTVYNNDYSTNSTTQNVTVVIENYADEVDVDELVRQINRKLAEEL